MGAIDDMDEEREYDFCYKLAHEGVAAAALRVVVWWVDRDELVEKREEPELMLVLELELEEAPNDMIARVRCLMEEVWREV